MMGVSSSPPSIDEIRRAPKVLLHDHLDGGLAAGDDRGAGRGDRLRGPSHHAIPTELAAWMTRGANRHDLVLYLETFVHTVGVMQTPDALARVARECAEDLADDGVVYAEVRFAPELHLAARPLAGPGRRGGPRRVPAGRGVAAHDPGPDAAHRDADGGTEPGDRGARGALAQPRGLRLRHRGGRGRLPAHPPPRCLRARSPRELPPHDPRRRGLRPAVDLGSRATVRRGAPRPRRPDRGRHRGGDEPALGRLAALVRDKRVPLELCPLSNVHSGAAPSIRQDTPSVCSPISGSASP